MASRWEEVDDQSSKPGFLKRTIGGSLAGALESLQGLGSPSRESVEREVQNIATKTNAPRVSLKPHTRSSDLARLLGTTREELAPQGAGEEFLQKLGSQAPFAVGAGLGNGLKGVLSALGRNAAGVVASTGAEKVGLPEWAQNAAQLGTELAIGAPKGTFKSLSKHKSALYDKARQALAPYEAGEAKALKPAFESIYKFNEFETSSKVKDIVNHAAESIDKNIHSPNGKIDIRNAWESKKSLNRQLRDPKTPSGAKIYLKELSNGLNQVLEDYKPSNASFWKNRTDADKIETVQNMKSVLSEFADEWLSSKGSIAKKPLIPLKAALKTLGSGERAIQYLKVKPVRTYLGKLFEAAITNTPKDIAKYALRFEKSVNDANIADQWQEVLEEPISQWEEIS